MAAPKGGAISYERGTPVVIARRKGFEGKGVSGNPRAELV